MLSNQIDGLLLSFVPYKLYNGIELQPSGLTIKLTLSQLVPIPKCVAKCLGGEIGNN